MFSTFRDWANKEDENVIKQPAMMKKTIFLIFKRIYFDKYKRNLFLNISDKNKIIFHSTINLCVE